MVFKFQNERNSGHIVPKASISYHVSQLQIPAVHRKIRGLNLADTAFKSPAINIPNIDMIINAKFAEQCFRSDKIEIENVVLKNSKFGWVVIGAVLPSCA